MFKPRVTLNDEILSNLDITKVNNISELKIHVKGSQSLPLTIQFYIPINDLQFCWHPLADGDVSLKNEWEEGIVCRLNQSFPVISLFNQHNINRFSLSCNDLMSEVLVKVGVHEESASVMVEMSMEVPKDDYFVSFTANWQGILWSKAVQQQVKWLYESSDIVSKKVPNSALHPVLSTWYSFHQNVTEENILKEVKRYQELGTRTVILDDGWQTDDGGRRYAYTGDWEVSENKFPHFSQHVADIQSMGISYLLWLSLPYLGIKAKHWSEFEEKVLYVDEFQRAGVLDIRQQDVQDYLINVVQTIINQYGIDGLKLDFLETFYLDHSSSYGVAQGIIAFLDKLESTYPIVKDFLIEYRQDYVNPLMMQYCNIVRVKDCPNNYYLNRIRAVDLRLACPYTAVHSDMIMWHPEESLESAALQLINVLFIVPQLSVNFEKMSQDEKEMVSFWLNFYQKNQKILLSEQFSPLYPQEGYSQIQLFHSEEGIILNYSENKLIKVKDKLKKMTIINGTFEDRALLEIKEGTFSITVKSCMGTIVEKIIQECSEKTLLSINVPRSGLIEIMRK